MINKADIDNVKTDIKEKIGQKIMIKGALGRNKFYEKEGIIENVYPNLFIVKYEENERNVTYSYTDIWTKTVEVQVFNGQEYSPLNLPEVSKKF